MATIPEALAIAVQHHQAGQIPAAEQIYRQILQAEPRHPYALHLLGVIALQGGKYEAAVECIARAIESKGNVAVFHGNLGKAYHALHRTAEAVSCFRRTLELKPDFPEVHNSLGNALREQGNLDDAAACFRRALELNPDYAEASNSLGNAWKDLGNLDEAIARYRRALELQPDYAEAHNNLGAALQDQGKFDEAIPCYRRALELKEEFAEAHNNLGAALQEQGKPEEAVPCYLRALELKPDYAEAHINVGNVFREQGKLYEAVACYRRAMDLRPAGAAPPGFLVSTLQQLCCWEDLGALTQRAIDVVDGKVDGRPGFPVPPFSFLILPATTTAEQQLRCARQWVERHVRTMSKAERGLTLPRPAAAKSKITVGYLSADFHSHATALLIAELFEKHDRERFEVFGYSYGPDDLSPTRRRLVDAFDRFIDVKDLSSLEAARRIAADGVDVLVDLKGYTKDARTKILALRPAPIQVNYLGYPGTMGAEFMDYILVDDYLVPPDQQPFFTEKLLHLPGSYQVNDSQREISSHSPSRGECHLPAEGFVFCSFNNSYKITPEMFDVWMRLLKAVSGSVLWLLEGNSLTPANLRREAEARGVAGERLVVAPRLPPAEHLARHRLADLFLDTFPVNAHTTASDALWAGCPLLTLSGKTFISRVAGSLLRAIGLPELITTSVEGYERTALRLARNPEGLAELRTRLAENRLACGLFDGGAFARKLEKAYAAMWKIHVSGEKPRHIGSQDMVGDDFAVLDL